MINDSTLQSFVLALDIKLTAPMHITDLGGGRYMPDSGNVLRRSGDLGLACSLTRTQEVMRLDGKTDVVPTIPSNTLGGRLRRMAAELIADSFVQRGIRISPDAFNTLSCGSAGAKMLRTEADAYAVNAAKKDPYLGIFGGTAFAFASDLIVYEGWPNIESTKSFLRVPPVAEPSQAEAFMLTSVLPIIKKDDVKDMRDPSRLASLLAEGSLNEYLAAISEGREDKQARMAARKEEKIAADLAKAEGVKVAAKPKSADDKKTELSTVATIEVIKTGVTMALQFEFKARSPAHLGLMLKSVQRMCDGGQIGGKATRGFGTFVVTSARLFPTQEGAITESATNLWSGRGPDGHYHFTDAPHIMSALEAAEDYINTVSADEVEVWGSGEPISTGRPARKTKEERDAEKAAKKAEVDGAKA